MTAIDCGKLHNPAIGQVSHTAGTKFGQTATYTCDAGYNLVGVSTRTCQATGVWSGSEPTCQCMYVDISACALKVSVTSCHILVVVC